MWTKRTVLGFLLVCAFMIAAGGSAAAQSRNSASRGVGAQPRGLGVRAGASADPDQFYIGVHKDLAEIVDRLWFRPNAEVGFGSHAVLFALNGEFLYNVHISSREWTPYVGGGPSLLIGSFRVPGGGRDTDAGGGFNFVGGVQQTKGFMAEIKLGVIDSPDFKVGVGWTW
jgi:hypothetical protein